METSRDVSLEEDDRLKYNWRELVTLPEEYSTYRQPMMEMLDHFDDMWDGHLERIKAAKH